MITVREYLQEKQPEVLEELEVDRAENFWRWFDSLLDPITRAIRGIRK